MLSIHTQASLLVPLIELEKPPLRKKTKQNNEGGCRIIGRREWMGKEKFGNERTDGSKYILLLHTE